MNSLTRQLHLFNGQDYFSTLASKYPWLLSLKDKGQISASLSNIHKTRNLYITGHMDGTISFWDASCPLLLQIFMIKQQVASNPNFFAKCYTIMNSYTNCRVQLHSNNHLITSQHEDNTSSRARITSLQFDTSSSILISGDQGGTVSYSTATRWFLVYVLNTLPVH